jgi:hypothetical protein
MACAGTLSWLNVVADATAPGSDGRFRLALTPRSPPYAELLLCPAYNL